MSGVAEAQLSIFEPQDKGESGDGKCGHDVVSAFLLVPVTPDVSFSLAS